MSEEEIILFSCYHSGKISMVDGKAFYVGGGHRFIETQASLLFIELMNQLPVSLYGNVVSYKVPFDELEDRKRITNGDGNFQKMCNASIWTKSIDIYVEPDYDRDGGENEMRQSERVQSERVVENERRQSERVEAETVETERRQSRQSERVDSERRQSEHQFPEEARVERNVADFVDEEVNEYATPVCSDDEGDHDSLPGFVDVIDVNNLTRSPHLQ